jgi:hypothetical protein
MHNNVFQKLKSSPIGLGPGAETLEVRGNLSFAKCVPF